jgi:hypothetical protein
LVGGFLFDEYLYLKYIKVTYKDLLQQYVNTGVVLNEYQFNRMKDNSQFIGSYFKARSRRMGSYRLSIQEYEQSFLDENPKYLNKVGLLALYNLYYESNNKNAIAKRIIELEGDNLDWLDMFYLIRNSWDPQYIVQLIGIDKIYEVIKNLDFIRTLRFLKQSIKKDYILKLIIDAKGDDLSKDDLDKLNSHLY